MPYCHFLALGVRQNGSVVKPVFTPAVFISRSVLMMNSVHLRVQFNETYNAFSFFNTAKKRKIEIIFYLYTQNILFSKKE